MKYVCFSGGNGYCGCDYEDYVAIADDTPESWIEQMSVERAYENAESYAHVALDDDFTAEEEQEYYDNLDFDWRYVTEETYLENNS